MHLLAHLSLESYSKCLPPGLEAFFALISCSPVDPNIDTLKALHGQDPLVADAVMPCSHR